MRIRLKDLRQRTKQHDKLVYRFVYQAGSRSKSFKLNEGEITIGSSTVCNIIVKAAGVSRRHVRLKRHGDSVFIQPLGSSKVILDGATVEELKKLPLFKAFTFGSVSGRVECLSSEDQQHAVRVRPVPIKSFLEDGDSKIPEPAIHQLNKLNDSLEKILQARGTMNGEQLLEILFQCLAPTAAALYKRKRQEKEWVLLAELIAEGGPQIDFDNTKGLSRFTLKIKENELLLLALFSSDSRKSWQEEVCRQILMQSALLTRIREWEPNAGETRITAPAYVKRSEQDVWRGFVGSRVRKYLDTCTEMCRNADTILLLGDTGTGKELAAHALHRLWKRKGAFIALNCAAVPDTLLDAELFGVEAGAATGVSERKGRIEQARGGTLFLDEISELPSQLQAKLLRVLQEREYFSVGGIKLLQADVHIVASSNLAVEHLLKGTMREDLYFRLAKALISLPPLRERSEDLAALCEYFLNQLERQSGRGITGLSLSALKQLKSYSWPGNLRELQNMLRYLYFNTPEGGLIHCIHLPKELETKTKVPDKGTLFSIVKDVERHVITKELELRKSVSAAADALGLSEGYLYRKIKKLGLNKHE